MRKIIVYLLLSFLLFVLPKLSFAQVDLASKNADEGNWNVYLAQYEEGVGSVTLNMDLIHTSPQALKPFIVITGITSKNCGDDGFPHDDELERLYQISDAAEEVIASKTTHVMAGTFTQKCQRLSYLYVRDTTGLRQALTTLYKDKYSVSQYYINIKEDREWKAYREFLYPNEVILEDMANRDVLISLLKAGDDLSKARQVDHWLYFPSDKSRKAFITFAKKQGFKIEETGKAEGKLSFKLRISRTDKVDPSSINALTLELKKEAKKQGGEYDGWETFVMK